MAPTGQVSGRLIITLLFQKLMRNCNGFTTNIAEQDKYLPNYVKR